MSRSVIKYCFKLFFITRWSGVKYLPNTVLHPLGPYSSGNPIFTKTFKSQYSIHQHVNDPGGLPDDMSWMWTGDWQIQEQQTVTIKGEEVLTRALDQDGWFYAFDWSAEFHPDKKNFLSYVRRRKWERLRRTRTAIEFFELLVKKGFNKELLNNACSISGCVSSTGKIDFGQVLSYLESASRRNATPVTKEVLRVPTNNDNFERAAEENRHRSSTDLQAHQLWMDCLARSCCIINTAYNIIANTRLTKFINYLKGATPPTRDSSLEQGDEQIWRLDVNNMAVLTPHGSSVMQSMFNEISCSRFAFNDTPNAEELFTSHVIKLVMEDNHFLCDSALTVLRREFCKC